MSENVAKKALFPNWQNNFLRIFKKTKYCKSDMEKVACQLHFSMNIVILQPK